MILSNAIKITSSNFKISWKLLLYRFIVVLITASIAVALALPTISYIIDLIAETGFFNNLLKLISEIISGNVVNGEYLEIVSKNLEEISAIIISNTSKLVVTYLYLLLCLIISSFLNYVADFAVGVIVNTQMDSNGTIGFTRALFSTLNRSTKFALVKILYAIPFDIIITTLAGFLMWTLVNVLGWFMPFFVTVIIVMLVSFRQTLFTAFLPSAVTNQGGIFKCFNKSVAKSFASFWTLFSTWVIVILSIMSLSCVLMAFTFGVGLIILIAIIGLLFICVGMVYNYHFLGKKYYINHDKIIKPRTLFERELAISQEALAKTSLDEQKEEDDDNEEDNTTEKSDDK